MKLLILIITLTVGSAWADTALRCRELPSALYPSNASFVRSLELITYVNHFSLTTLMAMKLETDSGELLFTRDGNPVINTTTQIKMIQKMNQSRFKLAWLLIDRTPRLAMSTRTFKGVLFVSEPLMYFVDQPSDLEPGTVKTLNFDCSF